MKFYFFNIKIIPSARPNLYIVKRRAHFYSEWDTIAKIYVDFQSASFRVIAEAEVPADELDYIIAYCRKLVGNSKNDKTITYLN